MEDNKMKWIRVIAIALLLATLLVLVPSGAYLGEAENVKIAVNAAMGEEPQESGYKSKTVYEDPSISVKITNGQWKTKGNRGHTKYWVARVTIAHASQLRTSVSCKYNRQEPQHGSVLAERVKAVLAINGDYFCGMRNLGVEIRQGKTYRYPKSDKFFAFDYNKKVYFDMLFIDNSGDLHIVQEATKKKVDNFKDNIKGKIINAFTFGPGLIVDGKKQGNYKNTMNGPTNRTQRMCLAQVGSAKDGKLEYLCICCEGPDDGSDGMTLTEFTDLVASFDGITNAYNMDGGTSSQMMFHYEKINCPNNRNRRGLADILYFASAYKPDKK